MAYTTIDKPSDYFNTVLYTGDGNSTKSISGVGFQLDWNWNKSRSSAVNHIVMDSVRGFGTGKKLSPNVTQEEGSSSNVEDGGGFITSTSSDGYALGTTDVSNNVHYNKSGETYVSWNWKAGTSFTNDASSTGIGSLDSSGSVSTTAGFSIISWTNSGSGVATVAHGLGVIPKMIIIKSRNEIAGWLTYHEALGNTHALFLNNTGAKDDNAELFNDTSPTSTVFTTGITGLLTGGSNLIAYCFAEKKGYSKFGSYTGNGNANGTFVYLGFKPAFMLVKKTNGTKNWYLWDGKRASVNDGSDPQLYANLAAAEDSAAYFDILSNGFKNRNSAVGNDSGGTYVYMAFAENPFVTSTGVPTTAR